MTEIIGTPIFLRRQIYKDQKLKMEKNKGTVLCFTIPDYRWQSNFYWDDVYAEEAIGIRKVKYITTIRDFHRKKRLKLWQE